MIVIPQGYDRLVSEPQPAADAGPEEDASHIDALLGVLLVAREMRRAIRTLMAEEPWATDAGFRPPCVAVLAVVKKLQPVSQREISERLRLDASDVVGVIDVLEAAKLVERNRDPRDRRKHAVVLTEAGRTAADRVADLRSAATDAVLGRLDPDERSQLVDLLRRVYSRPAPSVPISA